jgi:serine/threonine protein kinase
MEILPDQIRVLGKLGSGNYAEVFLVDFNGEEAAAKVIFVSPRSRKAVDREIAILQRVRHPNLISLFGTCDMDSKCFILQEFCAGGTLFEVLHNGDLDLSWTQKLQWLQDTASAMEYLHDNGIIHRDLKSLNCLLKYPVHEPTDQVPLKVADFGLGKCKDALTQDWGKMTIAAGTCHWMAPEVFMSDYAEPADVYSFSILMFEILCQEIPFEEHEPAAVGQIVRNGGRPDMDAIPPDCPADLSPLMVRCWGPDPMKRPTFTQIRRVLENLQSAIPAHDYQESRGVTTQSAMPGGYQTFQRATVSGTDNFGGFFSHQTTGVTTPALPKPSLPEDLLPSPEPDQEPQEYKSGAFRIEVRCERSRVSTERRELLGMVTLSSPEDVSGQIGLGSLPEVAPEPSEEPEPARRQRKRLGLDLILVLDVSASMSG